MQEAKAGTPGASPKRPATSPRGGWWGGGAPFDARAGSDSCQGNGPAAEAAAVLPGLPVEVLELIGRHLSLQGRLCLTCCCRALWLREDLLSSAALWGDLVLTGQPLAAACERPQALAAWLKRRRGAARRFLVDWSGLPQGLYIVPRAGLAATAVQGLAGSSGLRELGLGCCIELGAEGTAALAALGMLPALTKLDLSMCGLRQVPPELAGSGSTLQDLDLACCQLSAGGALRPLTRLTRLVLNYCKLSSVPPEVAGLTCLASLGLFGNPLGKECEIQGSLEGSREGPYHSLQGLTRLTFLDLGHNKLTALPSELGSLTSLQELNLSINDSLGQRDAAEAVWAPLAHLQRLTRLDLSRCGLSALPAQLSSLPALAAISLAQNKSLGGGSAAAFAPVGALTALRTLDCSDCGLGYLPHQLSACTALTALCISDNWAMGSAAAGGVMVPNPAALLARLPALRRLSAARCAFVTLPAELGALGTTLEELELSSNPLGLGGGPALRPLAQLTALTRLALNACVLDAVPKQLTALQALRELRLDDNGGLAKACESRLNPLSCLTSLTKLDVRKCEE